MRWQEGIWHPIRWLHESTGSGPTYALLILFGLNAVDELDRSAFGILLPEIQDDFGLSLQGILTLVALVAAAALALQIPIAYGADRFKRVPIAIAGASLWAVFSFLTGLATTIIFLAFMRTGSAVGKAVNDPTHNSLLADYYDIPLRPRVYSFHRAANAVGQFVGPLFAGLLAFWFSWRVPFLVFAFPTVVLVVLAFRMKDPVRGEHERRAMGASEEAVMTEEAAPSFAEAWRIVWKVDTLRRIWVALPFLAASLIGFVSLSSLFYEEEFGLNEVARGTIAAGVEPAQLIGLVIGARIGTRLYQKEPGLILRFLAVTSAGVAGMIVVFALAPWLGLAIAANAVISASLAIVGPGILAALSLAIPPRARSLGFAIGSLWVLPGLLVLPLIGWIGDHLGIRIGFLVLTPVFLVGSVIVASAHKLVAGDIEQVWKTAAARSEVAYERRQGRAKLLLVRDLDVAYDGVQVLFGVNFEVDEGEIVALLGTNGAGKSTLLKAISGIVEADRGAVIFDGREITHAPPYEVARHGVLQVPGGNGVFPSLTVGENLRIAGWLHRRDAAESRAGLERVTELFPVLADRTSEPAANLSGGQQQMLTLSMAFLSRPQLLMIDELSLGLAPIVVEQLLPVVQALRDQGTTIILVEQSVNLALTVAETAYFMEKGEIRFHGPTEELLARPDVLRSVFLEGAAALEAKAPSGDIAAAEISPTRAAHPDGGRRTTGPSEGGPTLTVTEVSRSFGGIAAVDRVSVEVGAGEIVGIIGPNGAGKTTLFDVISGFTRADRGQILLGDQDITALGPDRRARAGLGRSFQDARLFPALTVAETLAVALERWVEVRDPVTAALHLPAAFDAEEQVAARVDELLELLGLTAFRSKFVRELSTGSRRIVDLACVVAHRPTVVLLDEPSSGIAQREVEALGPVLLRVRDGLGASMVVVEHDMALVTSLADRLIAMDRGQVIASGSAADVLEDPAVVASYLGTTGDVLARSGARPPSQPPT